jgi:hypothetical protein
MSIPGPEVARTAPDRKARFIALVAQKADGAIGVFSQPCCRHISPIAGLCYNSLSLHGFLNSGGDGSK